MLSFLFFFFNDTATTEIYTLSLHDALPISSALPGGTGGRPLLDVLPTSYSPFLKPLKKSSWPSISLWPSHSWLCAISDPPPLWRTAAVVRNRRDIANHHDVQSGGGQRAYRGLAAGTRTLHLHLHALPPVLVARDARGRQRSLLRGIRRAFARAFEADCAPGRPAHNAAIRIRD